VPALGLNGARAFSTSSHTPLPQYPNYLSPQGDISDEKKISAEDYKRLATENYLSGKSAYKSQLAKTRVPTQFSAPIPPSRPATGRGAEYDPSSPYAQLAKEQYLSSKVAYKAQLEKTRVQTQFAGEPVIDVSVRLDVKRLSARAKSTCNSM